MGVGVGWGGLESVDTPWTYPTVRNLNTSINGAQPVEHNVVIEHEPPEAATYAFTLPEGGMLFAMWKNGVANDEDSGDYMNLVFPASKSEHASLVDVLEGFEQELIVESKDDGVYIRDILIKDYPLLIKLSEANSQ